MQIDNDLKIISLYKVGKHQEALKLLMSSYQERLYWHIRRIVIAHDDADDILQNTFIKIWKGLENFKGESQLYTWLFRIASNEVFSFIEKNKKFKNNMDVNHIYEFKSDVHPADMDGEAIQQKLENAIATLPEKQRMVFHLKYYEEMKYSEISEVLGTSEGALKANYHLAVKKIEEFLKSN
jgi:RNA polymerase sigma factor (sigma-70 family)